MDRASIYNQYRLQVRKYFWVLAGLWTAIIVGSFFWNYSLNERTLFELAKTEAIVSFEKNVLYRKWNAGHGGVYVPATSKTPPNPYLSYLPERDVITPSGRKLTLMNPAYMIRQVHEIGEQCCSVRVHLTSLNPINPDNAPDQWEVQTLNTFIKGQKEVCSITAIQGKPYLRFMRPFFVEKRCLRCHAKQGYKEGDVRGGMSISVPMDPYFVIGRQQLVRLAGAHGLIFLAGLGGLFFSVRRVTQHIQKREFAEIDSWESEQKFRAIGAAAQDAVIMMNEDGKISFWNNAAEKMFGYSEDQAMCQDLHTLIVPKRYQKEYLNRRGKFSDTGDGAFIGKTAELKGLRRDGREFPLELSLSSVKLRERWHAIGIIRDISERKRIEKERERVQSQLSRAQRMEAIGSLAGGIAHDFNNILFPIIGFAEMSIANLPEESPVRDNLGQILVAARRAKDLVSQILSFSRQEGEEALMPLSIQPIIKETLKLLRASVPTTIEIRQQIDMNCGHVLADPTQINQIVMNLCTNAYYVMREKGGVLTVALKEVKLDHHNLPRDLDLIPGRYAKITIGDTGPGMPPDVKERIFEPYFTTKPPGEGTGLGLSVVHHIVKNRGGDIQVLSKLGKGTIFYIYLPITESDTGDALQSYSEQLPKGHEHILLVDDEDPIVQMLRETLEGLGYRVAAFTNSIDALEAFFDSPTGFDLVITDQTMPGLTGTELSKRIMKIRNNIPIILCTGFSELVDEQKALAMGIRAYIRKPILITHLAKVIRESLDERKGE